MTPNTLLCSSKKLQKCFCVLGVPHKKHKLSGPLLTRRCLAAASGGSAINWYCVFAKLTCSFATWNFVRKQSALWQKR